ncbi:MAG: prolipoprotein diacylglyceryl transferase [Bacteriovoracaceae bacterium]|nr:prolipoprotein diacylglyceryl transferase [Bacteriovoracaceae bacterium]
MSAYFWLELTGMLLGLTVGLCLKMPSLPVGHKRQVYLAGVLGLIIGMKLPVLLTYPWSQDLILNGKTYMGGILGAFLAINLYKHWAKQTPQSFGGRWAIPLAIAAGFGKIGCYLNGCCGGHFFIPLQLVESAFQFTMAISLYVFYKKTERMDLLFPVYLLGYLGMRFIVEFGREEPRILGPFTIYHLLAMIFIPYLIYLIRQRLYAKSSFLNLLSA